MAQRNRVVTARSKVRLRLASDEWLVASVRRGDIAAFEALYERHSGELLAFCVYMLGSRQDAEDAVQATFASAYRALRADRRPVALRPWLFTIARNDCLSILRRRRPVVELTGEPASRSDPLEQLELREEVRRVFTGLRELPERQRAALVLAEVHGLSQLEIAAVLGVRADQVKAFIYQARSKLISERQAREADCQEIREELAAARGAALLRGRLRRHVRSCPDCRSYANGVARQRRQLGALLPVIPSLLRYRAIEGALGIGAADPATYAGGAAVGAAGLAEFAGGGFNALLLKVVAGVAAIGASAGVGVSMLGSPIGATIGATATGAAGAPSSGARVAAISPTATSRTVLEDLRRSDPGAFAGTGSGGGRGDLPELRNGQAGAGGTTTTLTAHETPQPVLRLLHEKPGTAGSRGGGSSTVTDGGGNAEHQQQRAEHQRAIEARRHAHETAKAERGAGQSAAARAEERKRRREAAIKTREERGPKMISLSPQILEARQHRREEQRRAREEAEGSG